MGNEQVARDVEPISSFRGRDDREPKPPRGGGSPRVGFWLVAALCLILYVVAAVLVLRPGGSLQGAGGLFFFFLAISTKLLLFWTETRRKRAEFSETTKQMDIQLRYVDDMWEAESPSFPHVGARKGKHPVSATRRFFHAMDER